MYVLQFAAWINCIIAFVFKTCIWFNERKCKEMNKMQEKRTNSRPCTLCIKSEICLWQLTFLAQYSRTAVSQLSIVENNRFRLALKNICVHCLILNQGQSRFSMIFLVSNSPKPFNCNSLLEC